MNRLSLALTVLCLLALAAGGMAVTATTASQDEAIPTPTPDTMTRFVEANGDAERGEDLFHTFQPQVGFACATCHLTDSEARLIGPGLLNIRERAAERVERQSAALYLYISIIRPDAYIVEDYPAGIMPLTFDHLFSERDLYDLVAYLLSLEGDPAQVSEVVTPAVTEREPVEIGDLPDPASIGDPNNGEVLFNTFQREAGFMCATCHWVDTEAQLIGPGLLNIALRAQTRVEDQDAVDYLFESIVDPDAYVVDGFPAGLMPDNWAQIYSEDELYDLVAYLLTLREE
jgi:cytochrome c2